MPSHVGIKHCEKCGKSIKTQKGGLIKHLRACKATNRRHQTLRTETNANKPIRRVNARPLSMETNQKDDSTISANGLRTLKRARSPGHDLDSGSRRKRPRLTEGSDGQDGNGMTSINCPDEQDELEGPNGWRPTIEDFVHHRGSYFSADLPFPYAETVHKSDSAFWRTFTSAVRNTGLLLDSIQAFKDVQQDPKQPGKPPINKVKRNKPAQVSPLRKDIDLHGFKESIRLFLRHLLGVGSSTPVDMWPRECCCGSFRIDLGANIRTPQNTKATNYFVAHYIKSYHSKTFSSMLFVQPQYVTPFWVSHMFREHFGVLRRSLTHRRNQEDHLASQKRKRRRERKLKKFRRRLDYASGQQELGHVIKILNDVGVDGMSEEESDVDNTHRPFFWLSRPMWRSAELSDLLHKLDHTSINSYHRAIQPSVDNSAIIPVGLPANCYSEEWAFGHPNIEGLRQTMRRPVDLSLML